MNKLFTVLSATLVSAAMYGEGLPVPYSSNIGDNTTQSLCTDWTIIDIDNDGENKTADAKGKWSFSKNSSQYSSSETPYGARYMYHSSNPGNDWLVSPAIHLEAGKEYKLRFHSQAYRSAESMKVTLATANDAASLAAGTVIFDMNPITPSDQWVKRFFVITVPADGDYYVGFYSYSAKNKWYIDINNFSITENVFMPAAPGNLAAQAGTASSPRERKVVLTWTNPTTDLDGNPLEEGMAVTQINIKRNGTQVATLTSPVETWTDTEETGLTDGIHTYSVTVVVNGVESPAAECTTAQVGMPPACGLPFDSGFNAEGYNEETFLANWTNAKGAASNLKTNWEFATTFYYGNRLSFRAYSQDITDDASTATEDAWIITPPINIPAAGTYEINATTAVNSKNAQYSPKLQLYAGTAPSADAMTIPICEELELPESSSRPDPNSPLSIEITEPGTYFFGFHAAAENVSVGANYYIYELKIESYEVKPAPVSNLTVTADENLALGATLNWTNPTTTSVGGALTGSYLVTINRGDEQIAQFTNTVGGEETATFHDTLDAAGAYTYTVTTASANGVSDEQSSVSVTSDWIGPDNVLLPYSTEFATDDPTVGLWKVFDKDEDGNTWARTSSGFRLNQGFYEDDWSYGDTYADNNDYLVSPRMTLAPGSYTFTVKAEGDDQSFYIGLIDNIDNINTKSNYLATTDCTSTNVSSDYTLTVNIEEEKDYWLSVSCNTLNTSVSTYYLLTVTGFKAVHNLLLPAPATGLTVTPSAAPALEATVEWTNPTESTIEGTPLESIAKAVVYRDGTQIGEVTTGLVPGERSSYIDSAVPEPGIYTYSVAIFTADGKNSADDPQVTSAWIGGGVDLPYASDDFSDWTILNVNNDNRVIPDEEFGDYSEPRTWISGYNGLAIDSQVSDGTTDDWAISPRFLFEEGKTYSVEVTSFLGYGNPAGYVFDIAVGPDTDHNNMTVIGSITTNAQLKKDAQTDVILVKAASADTPQATSGATDAAVNVPAGIATIGMHALNQGAVTVSKVTVAEYEEDPSSIDSAIADAAIMQQGDILLLGSDIRHISIFDLQGRRIADADITGAQCNIAGIQKGIYVIVLDGDNGSRTVKFAIR